MLAVAVGLEGRVGYMLGPSRSSKDWTHATLEASMVEVALERVEAGAGLAMVWRVFGSGARPRRGHRSRWAVVRQ